MLSPMRRPPVSRAVLTLATTALVSLAYASRASAGGLGDLASRYQDALQSGAYGPALGLTYLAGVLTALTPCVYPMIAITVSIFGARQSESRLKAAGLSGAYVLGIAGLMTPLGVASALAGSLFGAWTGNPWVMFPMALLFLALAASMFGAFDLALPSSLQNRLAQAGGVGFRGAFVMGLVAGLIAAPCAGPVISGLLAYISSTRDVAFGALSMFTYALGLGTLFFFVGTFALALPKTGRFVEWTKSVFGVVMVIMAIYFVRNFIRLPVMSGRDAAIGGVGAALIALGLAVGAIHLSFKEGTRTAKARKALGVTMMVVGAMVVLRYFEAVPPGAQIEWRVDFDTAREEARNTGRPLLVDFGADWCSACHELEEMALHDERVVAESRRFMAIRVDLSDAGDEVAQGRLREYSQQGLPFLVLHDGTGEVVHRITAPLPADEFLPIIRSVH